MPSVSGKFTGIQISNISGGSNLLEGNTGNATFNEGQQITYRSPNIPNIFTAANVRVTGYEFRLNWTLPVSNVLHRWFMAEQKSDGTFVSTGTLQERTVAASSTQVYGGPTDLFGFPGWTGVISDLSLNIAVPIRDNLASDDDVVINGNPGLTLTVYYTSHNKIGHVGGKLFVNFGKISITNG